MSPNTLKQVVETVGGAGCPCCPDALPFMHDIVNRLPHSRSTTYRYLVWGAKLGYIQLGTRTRGKGSATTFAISEAGEAWLSQWHKLPIAEWNALAQETARAL